MFASYLFSRIFAGLQRLNRSFPALALIFALALGAVLQPFFLPEAAESVQAQSQEELPPGVNLIVLMYHQLDPNSYHWGPYVISPKQLEKDLQYLRENGFTSVTLRQLTDYVYGDGKLPEKPVLITFDDGNESIYHYAWPLLKQYGMTGVVNILGSVSQEFSENPDHNLDYAYLTWEEIREMKESGVMEFGNHSYNLHGGGPDRQGVRRLAGESSQAYRERLSQDIEMNQSLLAQALGEEPIAFAYPFGYQDEEAEEVLRSLGFQILMGSYEKQNRITKDPECLLPLRRFNRPAGINTPDFFERLAMATP